MDDEISSVPEYETVIIPGATGPIPERKSPLDKPITTGIPVVKVNGRMYTRRQIARGTGIGLSHVSKIFKGTRSPSTSNLVKLAAYFNVSIEVLMAKILPHKEVKVKR